MKIMVVDDNAIVRAGLRAVLARVDSVTDVVEAEDAFAALETAAAESPEIVLLDISMPGRSGLDILPELVDRMSVIMLTSLKDPALIRQAIDAGARGYLVHGQLGVNEVAGAIETCRHGGLVLGREAAEVMLHPSRDDRPNPLREHLTDREARDSRPRGRRPVQCGDRFSVVSVRKNCQELSQCGLSQDRCA